MIKVMVALSNMLCSEGVKRVLELSGGISVAGIACQRNDLTAFALRLRPDVVIVDCNMLNLHFGAASVEGLKMVLLSSGEDGIAQAFQDKRVKGVIPEDSTPIMLESAIKSAARGLSWYYKSREAVSIPSEAMRKPPKEGFLRPPSQGPAAYA